MLFSASTGTFIEDDICNRLLFSTLCDFSVNGITFKVPLLSTQCIVVYKGQYVGES
jgi:hypothetical protein